eukprot:2276622-Karenia_brevis.AAC.1
MKRPVPIQEWRLAVYNLMEKRQDIVKALTLPDYKPCENPAKKMQHLLHCQTLKDYSAKQKVHA